MTAANRRAAGDQATTLLRSHKRLREASIRALRLMEQMKDEGALRLPFLGYEEAVAALKKELS